VTRTVLRAAIVVVGVLSGAAFVLQLGVLRPRLWPAGGGLILSGGALMASLAEPAPISVAMVPDPRPFLGQPVTVARLWPDGAAARAGLRAGDHVVAMGDAKGHHVNFGPTLPDEVAGALAVWRQMYRLSPIGPLTLHVEDLPGQPPRRVVVPRPAVWSLDAEVVGDWLRAYHFGPLAKHLAYTLAGLLIVALGARGLGAGLIALAFLLMGVSDAGLLMGAEFTVPGAGPLLLGFTWILLPLAFPVIGLALLHIPQRVSWLDRHRWVISALWLIPAPLAAIGLLATGFLLGGGGTAAPLAWVAAHPAVFSFFFGLGMLTNIGLVAHGVHRYRVNPDPAERRRIELMIGTAVPGVLAYATLTVPPLAMAMAEIPFRWPWPIALLLQIIVLASAVGVAWAVAVRQALSPRTVIRQGLQYALARRTLALLLTLPGVPLVLALIRQRDQPLAAVVGTRPLFYLTSIGLLVAGLRYRDRAQLWLDRRYFRTEYDAKEILLALASRVPSEPDPRDLVRRVLDDIDAALHPESAAVLADSGGGTYEPIHAHGHAPGPLRAGTGLAQLLQWSDVPLDVGLPGGRSPAARLPTADREWLVAARAALVVPVFAGSGSGRPLVGMLLLGPKRSEEPFSPEDRRLLAGIAAQMGLAADLWRLRRQVGSTPIGAATPAGATAWAGPGAIEVGSTIDGKYRVDALIGRGGMGAVYRARDLRLDRDVAVKVVRGELVASAEARERFRREAQLAARLQHPAIVTVFDYGALPGGAAYLVMEYVRGADLRSRLSTGPLDPGEAVRLLAALADAVAAAHREQVLHRDLKPENVLLLDDGRPKVLDFGIAKQMAAPGGDGTLTATGTIVGTPAYMAPEQIRGARVDARADVYSLGVMGYEMLTGRLPFGTGSFVDVAVRQAEVATALDTTGLAPAVAAVLRRAMAYTPDERPETASEMAAELRQTLDVSRPS